MSCVIYINGERQDNLNDGVMKINQILKTNLVKKVKFKKESIYTNRIVNSSLLRDDIFVSACYNLSRHETNKKEYEIASNTIDISNNKAQDILNNINLKKDIWDMVLFLESEELFRILEIEQIKNSFLFEEIYYFKRDKVLTMYFREIPCQMYMDKYIKLIFR